jgi:preprotein translocase subunit Sec61beta
MLQWRPRLVVLVAILVVIAVTAAGYIDFLIDGLTW